MIRALFIFWLLFVSKLVFAQANSASAVCSVQGNECDYYCTQATQLGCAKDNYLLHFGDRYCRAFLKNESHYSPHGQEVLKKIRSCLIEGLETNPFSCDSAEDLGFGTHTACYVNSGFCSLGLSDRTRILWTVREQVTNPRFQAVVAEILFQCPQLLTLEPGKL